MQTFNIMLACDNNGLIGLRNENREYILPWSIIMDTAFFRRTTSYIEMPQQQNVVIMGRNTFETLKNPLINRINIVLTSDITKKNKDNIYYVKSLNDALQLCLTFDNIYKIFVVGGSKLYDEAFNHQLLKTIYVTVIDHMYDDQCNENININILNLKKYKLESNTIIECYDEKNKINVKCNFKKYINTYLGELQYINLLANVYNNGILKETRNCKTFSSFGGQIKFNLETFPILTTKKMFFRGIFEEAKHLLLLGNTNTNVLADNGIKIWESNTSEEFLLKHNLLYKKGDIGPMYGYQLRHYDAEYFGMNEIYEGKGIDQLQYCLDLLIKDPNSRRIMMTTYNPKQADQGVLYPCHGIIIQFYISNNKLSCHMYQRSVDLICGLPFNIASYALITHIIVEMLNKKNKISNILVGDLILSFGDTHIYNEIDHLEAVHTHLNRIPFNFPTIKINNFNTLEDLKFTDIELLDYISHPSIKVKMIA